MDICKENEVMCPLTTQKEPRVHLNKEGSISSKKFSFRKFEQRSKNKQNFS
jgi:hypothetical protein